MQTDSSYLATSIGKMPAQLLKNSQGLKIVCVQPSRVYACSYNEELRMLHSVRKGKGDTTTYIASSYYMI